MAWLFAGGPEAVVTRARAHPGYLQNRAPAPSLLPPPSSLLPPLRHARCISGHPTRTGAPYAWSDAKYPNPLTPAAAKGGWKLPDLAGTVETAGKFNKLPVGGSLGLVAAVALIWATPLELMSGLGAMVAFLGIIGGMGLQRLLRWMLGWYADTALERAESSREADLKIARVRYYQREGILELPEARRFAVRIAREDLFGAPKPRGPRGPYRKRPAAGPAAAPDKSDKAGKPAA